LAAGCRARAELRLAARFGAVRVALDGLVPVYNPDGVLAALIAAVGESPSAS